MILGSRAIASETPEVVSVTPAQAQRVLFSAAVSVLIALDIGLVAGAFVAAYILRFVVSADLVNALPFVQYFETGLLAGVLASVLLALQGLADVERGRSWPVRLRAITSAVSTGTVIAVLVPLDGDLSLSRVWLALGWSLAVAALVLWRSIFPTLYFGLRRRLVTMPRAIVVGANPLGREVAKDLEKSFEVLGYVDNGSDLDGLLDRPLLGPIADLGPLVRSRGVDEIIVTLPPDRREQLSRVITRGLGREVDVKVLPEFDEHLPRRLELGRVGSRPYIGYAPVARVTWIKRAVDVLLAAIATAVLAPALLAIAVAIKVNSPGPVMYRQIRVGQDGRQFVMLKFRSMCAQADAMVEDLRARNEAIGPLFKIRRDPRVTSIGRFLRRFSLDELPQLFNVLSGDMSLVGPRPPLPAEVAKYEDWQLGRLQARPGMTGLWQVSGRSEVPFNDMVRLDLHYVRNWSFGLDLEIILRTIPAVVGNRGAY